MPESMPRPSAASSPFLPAGEPRPGKSRELRKQVADALARGDRIVVVDGEEDLPAAMVVATSAEEARARRWLDDLTAGAIEHELSVDQVVAAVDALHVGGWPGFLADDVAGYRWDDDEDDGPLSVLGWITAIGCDCPGGCTVRVTGVDPTGEDEDLLIPACSACVERVTELMRSEFDEVEVIALADGAEPAGPV